MDAFAMSISGGLKLSGFRVVVVSSSAQPMQHISPRHTIRGRATRRAPSLTVAGMRMVTVRSLSACPLRSVRSR